MIGPEPTKPSLSLMLPMAVSVHELRRAKAAFNLWQRLRTEGRFTSRREDRFGPSRPAAVTRPRSVAAIGWCGIPRTVGWWLGRAESSQISLFDVPADGGPNARFVSTAPRRYLIYLLSPGTIRSDGQMLVTLNVTDSWFNPLAQLDLKTGRITRLAGDNASDLHSPRGLPTVESLPIGWGWFPQSGSSRRRANNFGVTSALILALKKWRCGKRRAVRG